MLHEDRRRADSFGEDAEQYDRARPDYPAALVDFLLTGLPTAGAPKVLDVGCGTGIVTRLFAARGCDVLGVEPDARMAGVARARGATVEIGRFEEWDPAGRRFDLLVSGQAWHWVDPVPGVTKAHAALRPGGRIGLFWNHGRKDDSVHAGIDEVYRRVAPGLDPYSLLLGHAEPARWESAAGALREGGFADVVVRSFGWARRYSRDEWLDQLPTHSDHRNMPAGQRAALLDEIAAVIDAAGGGFEMRYEAWLVTAVRPGR